MADIEKVFTESEPTANLYVLRGKIKLAQYEKERAALDFKANQWDTIKKLSRNFLN